MERVCAEMAGTIARRYPNRARAFVVLFSHSHLHHPEHRPEFALLAFFNLPALNKTANRDHHFTHHGSHFGMSAENRKRLELAGNILKTRPRQT